MEDEDVLERILAGSEEPRDLPFSLLEKITDGFSPDRKIGHGGFAEVYKGDLRNNGSVAVKRIVTTIHTIDDRLFKDELRSLLKTISHQNVVRFLGFCSNTRQVIERKGSEEILFPQIRERLLCFEFISHGSLDNHITDELRGLIWSTRYQIIKEICEGLEYLHEQKRIKHMDLKPSNIMLDNLMVPKITDFGLARLDEKSHTAGERFLSRPYCAPEYEKYGRISFECDIYSLGVIIVKLVTGSTDDVPNANTVLRRWKCRWNELMRDTSLQAQQVIKCIEIAENCRKKEPRDRYSISRVIRDLNDIGNPTSPSDNETTSCLDDNDDMLWITKPVDLRLAFELNTTKTFEMELKNVTSKCVAFNIKTWCDVRYCIEPIKGIVPPRSVRIVKITMQAQETNLQFTHPVDDDEFILKSIKVEEGLNDGDITERMFDDEAGKIVDEVKLTVVCDGTEKQQVDLTLEPQADHKDIIGSSSKDEIRGTKRLKFRTPTNIISGTKIKYPRRDQARAVDHMTGAMGCLLPKLDHLLKHGPDNLETSTKKEVGLLRTQLELMHVNLCRVSETKQDHLDPEDQLWARKVRELSYDMEDIVDNLLVHIQGTEPITNHGIIADIINGINHQVKEVFDLICDAKKVRFNVPNSTNTFDCDPRILDFFKDSKELVGIDARRNQFVKIMKSGKDGDASQKQRKIVSIVGQGGLGKSTLAKAVYDRIGGEFPHNAFVTVGRNPETKVVLERILQQLDMTKYRNIQSAMMDEMMLMRELRDFLRNKRYLIVIDDIWDARPCEAIKVALPDDGCGSRIILTSRKCEVVEKSDQVCPLDPLSDHESMKLFRARLKSSKDRHTFDQPDDELCTKILRKCVGVPLAIITLASLLADKPRDEWPKVCSSIGFGNEVNNDVDNTRTILLYSYYDLPCYLKTCLLHLSTYPEDSDIDKDMLIWMWIAEGFVHEQPGMSLFKVGEVYLNGLISRGMILPFSIYCFPEEIFRCRVHDMVLDIIRSLAGEENFVTVLDGDDLQNASSDGWNTRRLAVHNSVLEQHYLANTGAPPKVRSLVATQCRVSMTPLVFPSSLRVLSMDNCCAGDPSTPIYNRDLHWKVRINLAGLLHLRYLRLYYTSIDELPPEIGDLRMLETLELLFTRVTTLPQSFIRLTRLKRFRSTGRSLTGKPIRFPDGMGNLASMEYLQLEADISTELGKMTELRVLQYMPMSSNFDDLAFNALKDSLSNLKKLEELHLSLQNRMECFWNDLSLSPQLRRLYLGLSFRRLPEWLKPSRLPHLSILVMSVDSLEARDLDNLGRFTELQCIVLDVSKRRVFPIASGAFPRLSRCEVYSLMMTYEPGAMPCLKYVTLDVHVETLMAANFDFSFDYLLHLEKLEHVSADIEIGKHAEVEVAMKAGIALRHAVDIHPNRPILRLRYTRWGRRYDPENPDVREKERVQVELLQAILQSMLSNNPNIQLDSIRQFRKLLVFKEYNYVAEEVISTEVVPRLMEFLTYEKKQQLQVEAAKVLRLIVSDMSHRVTKVVVDSGAVPIFIKLVNTHSEDVCKEALWFLHSFAVSSREWCDLVLGYGGLFPVLQLLNNEHAKPGILMTARMTLSTLCAATSKKNRRRLSTLCGVKSDENFDQVEMVLLALQRVIRSQDEKVLTCTCQALAYLCSGNDEKTRSVIESGLLFHLAELLMHPSSRVLDPVLFTICNIMAVGSDLLTQAVIRANMITPMVHLVQTAEFDIIRTSAAKAISNATTVGTNDQIKYLVDQGCIKPVCDLLVCPDLAIVADCLKCLENIVKVGEADWNLEAGDHRNAYAQMIHYAKGWGKIVNLGSHDNTEISVKAVKILNSYWLGEQDSGKPSSAKPPNGFNVGNNSSPGPGSDPIDASNEKAKVIVESRSLEFSLNSLASSRKLLNRSHATDNASPNQIQQGQEPSGIMAFKFILGIALLSILIGVFLVKKY